MDGNIKRKQSKRGWIVSIILGLCIFAYLGFRLFEPIFVWNSGWQNFPENLEFSDAELVTNHAFDDVIAKANTTLEQSMKANKFPALSIAVGKDGQLIWARAMGYRNLEDNQAVTLDTKFRIGSTSKAITATAAAKLVDENVLNLDLPIRDLVPYFPIQKYDLTPRQLLTHTAGIRHYEYCWCFPFDEYSNQKHFSDVESAVGYFANSPLLYEPGTQFSYSSYGFVLASAAMEGASGLSFDEIIERTLVLPLGLPNTMREGLANNDIAIPYVTRDNSFKRAFPVDNSLKTAGGGFVSTPTDLVKMTQGIMSDKFIDADLRNSLFFTPQKLANNEINEQNYALGWRSHNSVHDFKTDKDVMITHHGGVAMGGISFLIMYPEYKLSISVVANKQMEGVGELVDIAHSIATDIISQFELNE